MINTKPQERSNIGAMYTPLLNSPGLLSRRVTANGLNLYKNLQLTSLGPVASDTWQGDLKAGTLEVILIPGTALS
jgi:hypothetical protein